MQKIISVGDFAAVTLPEESLQELGISIGDHVRVSIVGSTITIEPLADSERLGS